LNHCPRKNRPAIPTVGFTSELRRSNCLYAYMSGARSKAHFVATLRRPHFVAHFVPHTSSPGFVDSFGLVTKTSISVIAFVFLAFLVVNDSPLLPSVLSGMNSNTSTSLSIDVSTSTNASSIFVSTAHPCRSISI